MKLRYSSGAPYQISDPFGPLDPHNPDSWNLAAVPDFIRYAEEDLEHVERMDKFANTWIQALGEIGGAIPVIGGLLKSFSNIALGASNRKLQQDANYRNEINARYANWYNSPLQQLKRMRKAGLNPYIKEGIKNQPSVVPHYEPYLTPLQSVNSESLAGLVNAFTNAQLVEHRIENLDSLTAINEYKEQYLLPQLFSRNGYINTIYELQAAFEEGNYNKERLLKQKLLETSYSTSLCQLAEEVFKTAPNQPNSYTLINPSNGMITYINPETGEKLDISDWKFTDFPPALQEAYLKCYSMTANVNLTRAREILTSSQMSVNSALANLYNANASKVQIDVDEWNKYKVWPSSDATLRYAAGSLPASTYWGQFGLNNFQDILNMGYKVGAAYANPSTFFGNYSAPVPKGGKPFINANVPTYNSPYNFNY